MASGISTPLAKSATGASANSADDTFPARRPLLRHSTAMAMAASAPHAKYADKYGMTYEVMEQAIAGAIPEYHFLDNNAYEGACKLSSVDGFGNFQSHSYGITGGNNAENQVWGRIAARHAAGLEPWDGAAE